MCGPPAHRPFCLEKGLLVAGLSSLDLRPRVGSISGAHPPRSPQDNQQSIAAASRFNQMRLPAIGGRFVEKVLEILRACATKGTPYLVDAVFPRYLHLDLLTRQVRGVLWSTRQAAGQRSETRQAPEIHGIHGARWDDHQGTLLFEPLE